MVMLNEEAIRLSYQTNDTSCDLINTWSIEAPRRVRQVNSSWKQNISSIDSSTSSFFFVGLNSNHA
jgi:hypothetical protein